MGECHATAGSRCRGTRVIFHERCHRFAQLRPSQKISHRILERPFDVGLHIVFKNKAAHDKYQDADYHKKFIEENKDNWKKVRVFDSLVD